MTLKVITSPRPPDWDDRLKALPANHFRAPCSSLALTPMPLQLRDLIRAVRACKTAAEERAVISKECALIRTAIKEEDEQFRHRNVAKLMYIHMLGYPTHFGQMECLKLVSAASFAEKRIGYLGLTLLLTEQTEVLMLVTNSLKVRVWVCLCAGGRATDVLMRSCVLCPACRQMDLTNSNQYIAALSLVAIGNLATQDMARDLAPDIDKVPLLPSFIHLDTSFPLRADDTTLPPTPRPCPALEIEQLVPPQKSRLGGDPPLEAGAGPDRAAGRPHRGVDEGEGPRRAHHRFAGGYITIHHHVVTAYSHLPPFCACMSQLMEEVLAIFPETKEEYQKLVPSLVRLLRNFISMGFSPEHDVGGITDPFVQVKLLTVLRRLGKGSDEASEQMNDVLAQVATNTETSKNAGNAILYECVQTIMGIESDAGLRVLAVNILGRFLLNRDNNIRYVALNSLSKVCLN
jgi:AP-1 complex subunit gamma-1